MTDASKEPGKGLEWSPRWYLWDGGFAAIGRNAGGVVPPHTHHAVQVTLATEGLIRFWSEPHGWREMRGGIVMPDVTHSFDGRGLMGIMLFVDPESLEGRWLRQSLRDAVTPVPDARMERIVPALVQFEESPLEAMEPTELVRHTVAALCADAPPTRALDPRVARAIEFMRGAEIPRLRLEDVADSVFLSPSRFAHLFSENVGLPFRRYLLWLKLGRAMLAIGRGRSLSQAAHTGGFSDSAHLTRTFHLMFGMPPSVMMRGEFFVVPAPFQVDTSSA